MRPGCPLRRAVDARSRIKQRALCHAVVTVVYSESLCGGPVGNL